MRAQHEITVSADPWSDSGGRHRYRSVLDPGLDVVSSGICLSGRDGDFDLTSLVSVMAAAPGWSR